ncbi:ladderlectin-like isoform X2 [Myxocyprinus asiaticus]|uniref:ladderlectin-like isoform X2 n=1 Tax=Myxocyprinus asiaticus TaxID=70543 RepID=UPI0022237EAE|nr:ladderlectin-like isoform X2 [Myxocyprinus asiaticus]
MAVWTIYLSFCLLFVLGGSACQDEWTAYGYRCFKFFNIPKTWVDAEKMCLAYDGNLASVHTHKEYTLIQNMIPVSSSAWIGGYDAVSEGVWFWSDGSKMNLQLWNTAEPNNAQGVEHCIEIDYGEQAAG